MPNAPHHRRGSLQALQVSAASASCDPVGGPATAIFSSLSLLIGDKELIQEVLFDAVVSAPIEAYWTSLALNKSE